MAITETRNEPDTHQEDLDDGPTPVNSLEAVLGSADHKTIGRSWVLTGLVVLFGSLIVSLVAAVEASDLGGFSVAADADQFTQVWSLGREALIFGAVLPILVGLATFLVPLQVGAPAIAFARGASGAFWVWLTGMGLTIAAYIANGGPGGGRTDFVVLWIFGLGMVLIGLTWAMVTVATTAMAARTTGMTFDLVPFTTWGFFVFSLVGILTLPAVMADLVVAYFNVTSGVLPLDNSEALTGITDSVSLTPTLYMLAIPVFAMAADIVGVHSGAPLRRNRPMLVILAALGVVGYGVDFVGLGGVRPIDFNNLLFVIGMGVAPLVMLAALGQLAAALAKGKASASPAIVGSFVAGLLLIVAAVASLLALGEPIVVTLTEDTSLNFDLDQLLVLNGTTFHDGIRGLVLGGAIVAAIAAVYHWSPKLWGRAPSAGLTLLSVLAAAAGALLWGIGAIIAGVDDQANYPVSELVGGDLVEPMNTLAMVGIAILLAGVALALAATVQVAISSSEADGIDSRWSGGTLEWATDTPPKFGNFESAPVVHSALPLLDHPDTAEGESDDDDEGEDA